MAHAHEFAGVYDAFGRELTKAHLAYHYRAKLGDHVMDLAAKHTNLMALARDTEDETHPVHAELAQAHDDLANAAHGRLSGLWTIDRWNAPIEWYAAKILGTTEDAVEWEKLPAAVRVQADSALKRDQKRQRTEFEEGFENLFLTVGITAMWQQSIGTSISANSGGSPAQTFAYYNNTQARIAVGDSSTAASAGQTWLQASSNKYAVVMDATFPTQSTNQAVFRVTVTSGNGNYAWNEFVIDNGGGSNSTSTTLSGGSALDRVVSAQGTKASGQTWQPSMTLSIS